MVIPNLQVHHVIRAYSQQLSEKTRSMKNKGGAKVYQRDEVTLSTESKRRLMADRISQEIMNQFMSGTARNETAQKVLSSLSREYGSPLDVGFKEEEGFVFKPLNGTTGALPQSLSPADNEHLRKRLLEITQATIYDDLSL